MTRVTPPLAAFSTIVTNLEKPVVVLVMTAVAVAVYRDPNFIWSTPSLLLILGSLVAVALRLSRIPAAASLFFLVGALSLAWSLTPANTVLNTLWELVYLGALAAGSSLAGFALVNVWLLAVGLERTLLLDVFDLAHYFSGSAHYLAGAQGLLFLPFCLSGAVSSSRWPNRLAATLAAAACMLLILNSGARAVYLPAALVLPAVVLRLALTKGHRVRAIGIPTAALALVLGFAVALPGPTVWRPLGMKALAANTEVVALDRAGPAVNEPPAVTEEGGIGSRLKMWNQALHIGLSHPLGTGAGSFRDTIHAFQRYPLIGFSSAHNVFLEVFATGGWLRLGLLLAFVSTSLWLGWNSSRWPLALGSAGLWATMCFDITGQMPGIMTLAFWSLGSSAPVSQKALGAAGSRTRTVLSLGVLLVSVAAALWWYVPCKSDACVFERHLGYRSEVQRRFQQRTGQAQRQFAERSVELNPESFWAWRLLSDVAEEPQARLAASRALAQKFPLASPDLYLRWAQDAISVQQSAEAQEAVLAGLEVFPPGLNPAGVPFGGRAADYDRWLQRAQELLESASEAQ
jgi:O-antigen ligase